MLGCLPLWFAAALSLSIVHTDARQSELPPMIAYWSGYELGNCLSCLKDQPFGIVILTMAYFYSDVYMKDAYDVCGWSLNVAVQECRSNNTVGTHCGVKEFVEPPPACCTKDITQPIGPSCPGKPNCDLSCAGCSYGPEPDDCCFTRSGIDTRYLTLRHRLEDIRSDVKALQSVGKKVMISMFDRMDYKTSEAPSVTLAQVNAHRASIHLVNFVTHMGLDGVDFNYEHIDCADMSASACPWIDIIRQTRGLLPDSLISVTTYAGAGDALGILRQVHDVIDFAQEDSYQGATSFFVHMKQIVGERKVYYGIEADFPRTSLAEVSNLAASYNASGAAGLFLWVANRDTNISTSCLDPVRGGPTDHPSKWAYTNQMWSAMFPHHTHVLSI